MRHLRAGDVWVYCEVRTSTYPEIKTGEETLKLGWTAGWRMQTAPPTLSSFQGFHSPFYLERTEIPRITHHSSTERCSVTRGCHKSNQRL